MRKKLLSIITLLCLTVTSAWAQVVASGSCGDQTVNGGNNVTWKITGTPSDYTLTISGTGNMADYSSTNTCPWNDYRSQITSVVIEDGVTSIGNIAFYDCKSLTSVTIPASVTSIGNNAFYKCKSLTSVTIPASVTFIDDNAFYECKSLTSVTIPASVTTIGNSAFFKCESLTSVTIPASVTTIDDSAFGFSGLTSVEIPTSVTSIPQKAFEGCTSLTAVTIPANVKSIGMSAFEGCKSLTSVTIPASVQSIGEGAFYKCSNLEIITVDAGNTKYDSRNNCNAIIKTSTNTLIQGCKGCTTIPNGVTSIYDSAFEGCTSLTAVTIPASVTTIGKKAFGNCSQLLSIDVDTNNNSFTSEDGVLFNKEKTTLIQYPIGKSATAYTIPASVKTIDKYAFEGCTSLTAVTIPASVTTIGYAFESCTSLTTVFVLPTTVPKLEDYGFGFGRDNGNFAIFVPAAKYDDYYYASGWSFYQSNLKGGYTVTCPDGITEGTITADKALASDGETVTLTITPNTGYVLNTVSYNDTVITPKNGAYTFTMPATDVTITATWKKNYDISLTPEYTSTPSVYAGVENHITVKVTNNGAAAQDVVVKLLIDNKVIGSETIANFAANATETLNFTDTTIRPIIENTVIGNDNQNVVYTVIVKENSVETNIEDFSCVIVYNGNLGKDYAYPSVNPTLREFSFIGDVQVLTQDTTYMAAKDSIRNEIFPVDLSGTGVKVKKALLYVSYNWQKPDMGDYTTWTTSFNDETVTPIASYCDQGNLGRYGNYKYGVVVYDVTSLVVNGDNTFYLKKENGGVSLYPSSLIIMTDNPSSSPKAVYILEEADLLSASNNKNVDAIYNSSFEDMISGNTTLYVFAAAAQAGEGDLIINGTTHTDVWSGTNYTFDTFTTDVDPGDISVQFKATGSTILALHQMVVVDFRYPAEISVGKNTLDLLVGDTCTLVATTTPEGLKVTYTADGSGVVSVDENGKVTALKGGTGSITVKVGGDGVYAEDSTVVGITVIPTYAMEDLFSGSNEWTGYVAEEDLALPDGLSAYIITALSTGTATATQTGYIPKGEPVLLRRTDKNKNSYTALPYAGTGTAPTGNLLRAATATSQPAAYRDYLLYRDAFVLSAEGTLATGKVYLPVPQASQSRTATRSIIIDGDGTTSMDGRPWATDQEDGAWHDMQGRKYDNRPTKKGLYIHNGKKEVVR